MHSRTTGFAWFCTSESKSSVVTQRGYAQKQLQENLRRQDGVICVLIEVITQENEELLTIGKDYCILRILKETNQVFETFK